MREAEAVMRGAEKVVRPGRILQGAVFRIDFLDLKYAYFPNKNGKFRVLSSPSRARINSTPMVKRPTKTVNCVSTNGCQVCRLNNQGLSWIMTFRKPLNQVSVSYRQSRVKSTNNGDSKPCRKCLSNII